MKKNKNTNDKKVQHDEVTAIIYYGTNENKKNLKDSIGSDSQSNPKIPVENSSKVTFDESASNSIFTEMSTFKTKFDHLRLQLKIQELQQKIDSKELFREMNEYDHLRLDEDLFKVPKNISFSGIVKDMRELIRSSFSPKTNKTLETNNGENNAKSIFEGKSHEERLKAGRDLYKFLESRRLENSTNKVNDFKEQDTITDTLKLTLNANTIEALGKSINHDSEDSSDE